MAILNIDIINIGSVGNQPVEYKISTDDTLSTVTTAGYLNTYPGNIYEFSNVDYAWVSTTDAGSRPFQISVASDGVITLSQLDIADITIVGDTLRGLTASESPAGTWNLTLAQTIKTTGTPTYAGMNITSLSGFANATKALVLADTTSGELEYLTPNASRPRVLLNDDNGNPIWTTINASGGLITGILPIVHGGTNSGTALSNGLFMVSNGGQIVEVNQDTSMAGYKITNVATPTQPSDAVNKSYADDLLYNFSVKEASIAATTTALAANTYNNGVSGVGATLTADADGALPSIDGISLALNDRVLIKNELLTSHNGIYVVTQLGDIDDPWILTRAVDFDNVESMPIGASTYIAEGTVNEGSTWALNSVVTTVGTDAITFAQIGGAAAVTILPTANQTTVMQVGSTYTIGTVQDIATGSSPTFTALTLSGLSASQLVATTAGSQLQTLTTATYPSLTEISYVKGVTSAIQTQLDSKQPTITPAALTKVDDTNVTVTLGGTPATALLQAVSLTLGWSGTLGLSRGGTNANLSATGGTSQVLRQSSSGAAITVSQLAASDLSNGTTGSGAVVLATSPTLVTPVLGSATFTTLTSATANPSSTGVIRFARSDMLGWRNNANSSDLTMQVDASDIMTFTFSSVQFQCPATTSQYFGSSSGTRSTTGIFRMANNQSIGWRNAAASLNHTLTLNASDVFAFTSAISGVSSLSLGAVSGSVGSVNLLGSTSGTVSVLAQAAAGTYNFNLPITAGSSGNLLTSAGGGASAMTWTATSSTPSAGAVVLYDANGNISADNFNTGYATTATAAGTTTLTVTSTYFQYFTGSTTQTVQLPVTSTLQLGQSFCIVNNSTGAVTVQSSGANTLQIVGANSSLTVTCISTSGTGTASWAWNLASTQTASFLNNNFTANSSTAITLSAMDGKSQVITLTGNATITMPPSPPSTTERELLVELIQDGTGGRTVTWSGVTWATTGGVAPAINSAIGASTYFGFRGTSAGWVGFAVNQNIGVTDGSNAAAGYIGEVISSSVAIGSAVSLTTATAANITSISLTPGDWHVWANVGFIPDATTIPTVLTSSISGTSATQATSPNGGAFSQLGVTLPAGVSQVMPTGSTRINITTTTTYYLVATATFTVSTMTGYGAITARRVR